MGAERAKKTEERMMKKESAAGVKSACLKEVRRMVKEMKERPAGQAQVQTTVGKSVRRGRLEE
jgi:hypothetical protein